MAGLIVKGLLVDYVLPFLYAIELPDWLEDMRTAHRHLVHVLDTVLLLEFPAFIVAFLVGRYLRHLVIVPRLSLFVVASAPWLLFAVQRVAQQAQRPGWDRPLAWAVIFVLCVPAGWLLAWALKPAPARMDPISRAMQSALAKKQNWSDEHKAFIAASMHCQSCGRYLGTALDGQRALVLDRQDAFVGQFKASTLGHRFQCAYCGHRWKFRAEPTTPAG